MNYEREIARLQQDLERLRSMVPLRPVPSGVSRDVRIVTVMGGNTINPGAVSGVNYSATAPVSIPDYDPAALPSTVNGVGVAYDPMTGEYILIANYAAAAIFGGSAQSARDFFAGDLVIVGPTTTLPITASVATKTLYVIIGLG